MKGVLLTIGGAATGAVEVLYNTPSTTDMELFYKMLLQTLIAAATIYRLLRKDKSNEEK